jgi:hypothetical protein
MKADEENRRPAASHLFCQGGAVPRVIAAAMSFCVRSLPTAKKCTVDHGLVSSNICSLCLERLVVMVAGRTASILRDGGRRFPDGQSSGFSFS